MDLLPCPFCGGEGWVVIDPGNTYHPPLHRPQCKSCGGGLGGVERRSEAITAWNTRALITAARRPDHIVDADDMVGRPALPDREAVGEMDNAALDEHRAWLAAQLLDDVFFAYPKTAAMAKELSEAQAGEMRAIAREVYERLRAETAEAQRDAALEALRPFAEAEKLTNPHDRVAVVNVSDLRAASRAIGGGE